MTNYQMRHPRCNTYSSNNSLLININGYNTNNNNVSKIMAEENNMSSMDTMSVTNTMHSANAKNVY